MELMKIKSVVVGVALLGVVAARGAATNDLAGALRNGLFEEQVDHNLDAAIATYQSVVTKFDTDRQLAATAVFRLGECYRAEGKTNEAMAQYQRVVTDFSDQATLVKLSTQNLAELSGGQAVIPSSDTTNNFNARVQAILDKSKAQAAQDELAKLRTEYAANQAILARLKELNPEQLKQQLPNISPDSMLMNLMDQLNMAQQKLIVVKADLATNNPEYQTTKALADDLQKKVADQMAGDLASMDTRLVGLKAQIEQLEKDSSAINPWEQVMQMEAQRATMVGRYSNLVITPNIQPTTDEEDQEIVRIRAMIQNSPDLINAAQGAESTPLMTAAVKDQLQVARYLLDHGADVNTESFFQMNNRPTVGTPLHAAAENGHKKMVELLVGAGADVNAKTESRAATPLVCAANRGYPAVAEVLLTQGANPNLKDNALGSPLHYAVQNSSTNLVAILLAHGAEVNATNDSGQTPLLLAAGDRAGRMDLVTLLLDNKADVNARMPNGATALHFAAGRHRSEMVKLFLSHGAEINARDAGGETALIYAAQEGAKASADVLLAAGADPNLASDSSGDHQGWTALHYAASGGNIEIAEALLSHGANPNALTGKYFGQGNTWYEGTTPLMLAIDNKRPDLVPLLLRYKADPNLTTVDGVSPLQEAIGQTNIVDGLLRAGADVDKPLKNGYTPLIQAVNIKSKGTVETILAYKPDVNAICQYGFTALDLTRGNQELLEIAAILRAHGAWDNVPKFDRIQVSRPSAKYLADVFLKGTNDWNHFSLLEAVLHGVSDGGSSLPGGRSLVPLPGLPPQGLSGSSDYNALRRPRAISTGNGSAKLDFPDLAHLVVVRHTRGKTNEIRIPVNVLNATNGIDCSKDMALEFGDVVEIPEREHALSDQLAGLYNDQKDDIVNCLKGTVRFVVHGQTTEVAVYPYGSSKLAEMLYNNTEVQRTLLSSSDLSRVKVTRTDRRTGKKLEWTVDCSNPQFPPDLWLRDGDVVEVPEI